MSLSTLHTQRISPSVLATPSSSSSSAAALHCASLESPPPLSSSSASLSSLPSSSSSSPVTAMASPTTVYSDRHSLPRGPRLCPPEYGVYNQQLQQQQHHQQQQQHHHHHHHHRLPVQQPPLSGILADMVPARPKGVVRYPPFEDGQHPVARRAVQEFRISPFGSIQEYCRHIPYMSNKKTFFAKTQREGFEVFQYVFKLPNDEKEYHVMWDYNIGLVRMTPFFRCCNYGKTAPAKMLNDNPGLREITHSITGGAIVAQGYWMPYECARAMCATFCYRVSGALVPLFGPDFPAMCIPPHATEFERKVIDPALIEAATHEAARSRQMAIAEGEANTASGGSSGSGRGSGSGSSSRAEPPYPPRGMPGPRAHHAPSPSPMPTTYAMPPPPPPPQQQPSLRPLRAPLSSTMPIVLPPPVPVPACSPVVAPSVSPDYSMPPPPPRHRRGVALGSDGLPLSPVEQVALPSVAYITSLPPLSPGQPGRDERLWYHHHQEVQQQQQEYRHYDYNTASRAPSPSPLHHPQWQSMQHNQHMQLRTDRPRLLQTTRAPSDSYPSPPQLRSTLQSVVARAGSVVEEEQSRFQNRKHRRANENVDNYYDNDNDNDNNDHSVGRHRCKRPSLALETITNTPTPRTQSSQSSPAPTPLRRRAAAAGTRHHLPGRPPRSTATDTAAAALLVDFSVKVHSRSSSDSGGEDDCERTQEEHIPGRPQGRVSTIASLLCSD